MTEEILSVREGFVNDDNVESFQYIEKDTDQGTGSLNNQTELTITYQNQDAWLFPGDSYLKIEGTLKTAANADVPNNSAVAFINNGLLQLFSNAKYFLGTQQIEYFENVGITTLIHNYLTKSRNYQGGCWLWSPDQVDGTASANNTIWRDRNLIINPQAGGGVWNFSAMIPLSAIFNFCNDYKKVIYGMQHKISLTRTTNTRSLLRVNAAVAASGYYPALLALAADVNVVLSSLKWCMPYIVPSAASSLDLMEIIKEKEEIPLTFLNKRSEVIAVPAATTFNWKLQLSGGIERPRFLVFGFQVGRGVNQTSNAAMFAGADVNVISAYILLNGIRYPYTDVGTDYATNKYTKWYREYLKFYNRYNSDNLGEACLSYLDFIKIAPLYVFDVSNQPEKLKNTTIDATLNMTFAAAAPADTVAYCVMYFDSLYKLTGDSNKQIIQQVNID